MDGQQDLASVDNSGMKLTLANKRILGSVQLTKTIDGAGNPLAHDVKFDLYREGQGTPIKTNLATNSEGVITVEKLGEGNYYFKETKTIDGAILNPDPVEFQISEESHEQVVKASAVNKSTRLFETRPLSRAASDSSATWASFTSYEKRHGKGGIPDPLAISLAKQVTNR